MTKGEIKKNLQRQLAIREESAREWANSPMRMILRKDYILAAKTYNSMAERCRSIEQLKRILDLF